MIDEKDYICCFILILNIVNGMTKDNNSSSTPLYYKKLISNEVNKKSNGNCTIYDYETHSITKIN